MRRLALACAAFIWLPACSTTPTPIEPSAKAAESEHSPKTGNSGRSTLPKPPAYVHEPSARGRAAFAGYWVHLLSYSVATGTTQHLAAASSTACDGCNNYMNQIKKDQREGVRSDGFAWVPVSADPGQANDVVVAIDAQAYQRTSDRDHSVPVRSDHYEVGFELERHGAKWRVRELYIPK